MATKRLCALAAVAIGVASGFATASDYQKFYRPAPGITPERVAQARVQPAPAAPLLERASPLDPDLLKRYAQRGYVIIGDSSFSSGNAESEASALRQGMTVGADLVVMLDPREAASRTIIEAVRTPTTETSRTSGTATVYGRGGSVTGYGNATTTSIGSSTSYVPHTVNRTAHGAVYFFRPRFPLGVYPRDLNDQERQLLSSNHGVAVDLVVNGTPAFAADILVDDLIKSINGRPVASSEGFNNTVREMKGQEVLIDLLRNGAPIQKRVRINP